MSITAETVDGNRQPPDRLLEVEIQIDPHTGDRAAERGATLEEIRDTLETGDVIPAKKGRLAKYKVYEFNKKRRGKMFRQKRVEVIYTEEGTRIVTVTVYVFYGEWNRQ